MGQVRGIEQIRCSNCGRKVPGYDIINCGSVEKGYRQLRTKCFNAELAESGGLDKFEHAEFAPMKLVDCGGKTHVFHFQMRLFGSGVALDAFEILYGHPSGYEFQVIGKPEDDPLALLAQLIEKIRRSLGKISLAAHTPM